MNKEKTILFITSRTPFPPNSGRKSSLYHYCKIIKELGYRLIVASFDDNSKIELKPDFIDEITILENPNKKTKIFNILYYSFFKNVYPLQVSLYYDKNIDLKIKEIVKKWNPNVVIADMVRTTEYLKKMDNICTIADLDDRLSLRYQRQLECNVQDINPYGQFLNTLPYLIQKMLLIPVIKKIVMKKEIKLLKKYELSIGSVTDSTIFVAKKETQDFNRELGENKAITIPIGVDIEYYKYFDNSSVSEDIIGFVGFLSVAHNEAAVKKFINDVMPIILKKKPNTKFMVIGGGASQELKRMGSKNIVFTGYVEDVREYLKKCKLFVSPLTFGSGIKTKNLEAMALGLTVVTTSIGAENIGAVNNEDWIIEDDFNIMANKILDLLDNTKLRKKIGKNAVDYVKNNFTWDISKEAFKKIL